MSHVGSSWHFLSAMFETICLLNAALYCTPLVCLCNRNFQVNEREEESQINSIKKSYPVYYKFAKWRTISRTGAEKYLVSGVKYYQQRYENNSEYSHWWSRGLSMLWPWAAPHFPKRSCCSMCKWMFCFFKLYCCVFYVVNVSAILCADILARCLL